MNREQFGKFGTMALNKDVYKIYEQGESYIDNHTRSLREVGFTDEEIEMVCILMRACYVRGYKQSGADLFYLVADFLQP